MIGGQTTEVTVFRWDDEDEHDMPYFMIEQKYYGLAIGANKHSVDIFLIFRSILLSHFQWNTSDNIQF